MDIKIEYMGLRPGEKLYEERLMAEEGLRETENRMISIARPMELDDARLLADLERLAVLTEDDASAVRSVLREVVLTYHPNDMA